MENNRENEYLTLLSLLGKVSEGETRLVGQDVDRLKDAEGLCLKFYYHSLCVFHLSLGITIDKAPLPSLDYIDVPSITVVARAALESFLTFHHVFAAPETDEMKDFRYWSWLLSGMCQRQKFPTTKAKYRRQKSNEERIINDLKRKLSCNRQFIGLPSKQKLKIRKGQWRLSIWKELALDADLNELHAATIYAYLSGYAHSDSLSVLQIYHAKSKQQQQQLSTTPVTNTMIATANMIFLYCDVFPGGMEILKRDHNVRQLAEIWRALGQGKT